MEILATDEVGGVRDQRRQDDAWLFLQASGSAAFASQFARGDVKFELLKSDSTHGVLLHHLPVWGGDNSTTVRRP